jgi:hypothetical protein
MEESIEGLCSSVTEGRRSGCLFDTDVCSAAFRIERGKFTPWWFRTRERLLTLAVWQPGKLAAELAVIFAEAEMQRQEIK